MTQVKVVETLHGHGNEPATKTFDLIMPDHTTVPPHTRTVAECAKQEDAEKLAIGWNTDIVKVVDLLKEILGLNDELQTLPLHCSSNGEAHEAINAKLFEALTVLGD
jgi:hypothetical protein